MLDRDRLRRRSLVTAIVPLGLAVLSVLSVACAAPVPVPPAAVVAPAPAVECGRIVPDDCRLTFALVRAVDPAAVAGAKLILMDDTCPPDAACDRQFAFDTGVVMVPQALVAGVAPEPVAYHVSGAGGPEFVAPWRGPLPEHVIARIPPP